MTLESKRVVCISVDFQKDFTKADGAHFRLRASVLFMKEVLCPFLRTHGLRMAEIISDYRQPRPGHKGDFCRPGTDGYVSDIPDEAKVFPVWVKAANAPLWTRANIGDGDKEPGIPYEDPALFGKWLDDAIGRPDDSEIILCGLTIDRCVLCVAQELRMRGYTVFILEEAVDSYSGDPIEKETILRGSILNNWAQPISWLVCQEKLGL